MKYLAFDVHISHCELSVRNHWGKEIDHCGVSTETHKLIEVVKVIPGPKTLAVEEGPLADWMKRTLEPFVTTFIVCDPKRNRWIAQDDDKGDVVDASKLSHLLWGGYLKEVYHPAEDQQRFKELVLHYHRLTRQVARCKNILKAKFRQNGIPAAGQSIYSTEGRSEWLSRLLHPLARAEVEDLYTSLDANIQIQQQVFDRLIKQAARYPQIARFCKIPGIGPIHAATFFAIIDTPYRFLTKSKVWVYCGLGLKKRTSGGKLCRQSRKEHYNRYLKAMAKQATQSALIAYDNPFKDRYQRLLKKGVHPKQAHVMVARSLITTLWSTWLADEEYQPQKTSAGK